jgi:hypothetical protein
MCALYACGSGFNLKQPLPKKQTERKETEEKEDDFKSFIWK